MNRPKNMSRQAFSKAIKAKQRRKKLQEHNDTIHKQLQEPLHEQFQDHNNESIHEPLQEQLQEPNDYHNNEPIQKPNDLNVYALSHNILRIPPSIYPY